MNHDQSTQRGRLLVGTSSWTAKGWLGTFYPSGTKQNEFLVHYAKRYSTVEVDSTFYAIPRASVVENWRDITPEKFIFAAKAPQTITHERILEGVGDELDAFLNTMSLLGNKLGPILFQFPYFAKRTGITEDIFLHRLRNFAAMLPKNEFQFAVEVRNKAWVNAYLFEILHDHNLAFTFIDHPWMSPPDQLFKNTGCLTTNFAYIRWLGDRKGIENITKVWNETVVDRTRDIAAWAPHIQDMLDKSIDVYGYVNNHYGGYAPAEADKLYDTVSGAN